MNENHLTQDSDLQFLEARLSRTLKRVLPPSGLTERLRSRVQIPSSAELRSRMRNWRRLFVVFGGVMTGLLTLITLARAFYYLALRRSAA
ncbi:MAG: hypothetical protein LC099_02515 [Anaerolineales bacterium]|nr:hypothetical protein [Anaerolineales bacterium]